MIIEVTYIGGDSTYISSVKNYDFYPETKMLFVECMNDESFYIPVSKNVKNVMIKAGEERGYLEGHDEAR